MSEKGDWKPKGKYRAYLNRITDILDNGEQRTVRDVYYALEARGFESDLVDLSYTHQLRRHEDEPSRFDHPDNLPRDEWVWDFAYRYVKRAVKKARRAGYVDPDQIIDASRSAEMTVHGGWESPEDFVEDRIDGVWDDYYENFWDEQDEYIEVWLEKQSLASVFAPICNRHNVRLEATRGDWSDSKVYEASERLRERLEDGQDVHILYYGDYNPSGYHAPVSILDTMGYYGINLNRRFPKSDDRLYYDTEHGLPASFEDVEGTFSLHRMALTNREIEEFDLPENPVPSSTDKDATIKESFQEYVSEGRDTNIELNALKEYHRDYLEEHIEEGIRQFIDDDVRDRVERQIHERRDDLSKRITIDDYTRVAERDDDG